jgi:hypothetical protein
VNKIENILKKYNEKQKKSHRLKNSNIKIVLRGKIDTHKYMIAHFPGWVKKWRG